MIDKFDYFILKYIHSCDKVEYTDLLNQYSANSYLFKTYTVRTFDTFKYRLDNLLNLYCCRIRINKRPKYFDIQDEFDNTLYYYSLYDYAFRELVIFESNIMMPINIYDEALKATRLSMIANSLSNKSNELAIEANQISKQAEQNSKNESKRNLIFNIISLAIAIGSLLTTIFIK